MNEQAEAKMKKSASEGWRSEGNVKYTGALVGGINLSLKKSRLDEALVLYNKAFQAATTDEEHASAAKNLGLCHWRLADKSLNTAQTISSNQHFFKEGLRYLDMARVHGGKCKGLEWQSSVYGHLIHCMDEAITGNSARSYRQRIGLNEQYINCLLETSYKAECYLDMGQLVFKEGVTALHRGDYQLALSSMKECYRPIEEARRLADNSEFILTEANVLEKDCLMNLCTAESLQARDLGDDLLEKALRDDEVLLMTGVYAAMDHYRNAIVLTRENEVEMEATANSRLGVVYDKIIKRKDKAHDYFKQCIDLANSLAPKNFANEDWFKKAIEALKRYQDEQLKQENEEWNKNRVKYEKEFSKELKALKDAAAKGAATYLKHIYKNHPPKEEGKQKSDKDIASLDTGDMKSAIVNYHPDRQKKHGEEWFFLCEEITKHLTAMY